MSTERIEVGGPDYEKKVVLRRVGNSIRLTRDGVPGGEEIHIPVEEAESVADMIRALAEE